LKKLSRQDISRYQKLGNFDEHLITFNSQIYGDPYIYDDTYLAYADSMSRMLWLTLFELKGRKGTKDSRLHCLEAAIAEFKPTTIVTASPEKLESELDVYSCINVFLDKDYQVRLADFDENLRGGSYEDLRYRVKNAAKRGYRLEVDRDYTFAHARILSFHVSKREYNQWDYQAFLRLGDYIRNSPSVRLFNVFSDDMLIGFDVVDFLGDVMATPLGFCLDYPSLADFLMQKEIVYAKKQEFVWLDIGWACNPGLEEFKKKWKAVARFNIYVQEYVRKRDLSE
jgi:hypothetical protein